MRRAAVKYRDIRHSSGLAGSAVQSRDIDCGPPVRAPAIEDGDVCHPSGHARIAVQRNDIDRRNAMRAGAIADPDIGEADARPPATMTGKACPNAGHAGEARTVAAMANRSHAAAVSGYDTGKLDRRTTAVAAALANPAGRTEAVEADDAVRQQANPALDWIERSRPKHLMEWL